MKMLLVVRFGRFFRCAHAIVRRAWAVWRRVQRVRASHTALRRLDDTTLHDLGLDRSELLSVAAELRGAAAPARRRTLRGGAAGEPAQG